MPGAPRPKGKAKDIAYAILGVPANMVKTRKKGPAQKYEQEITYDNRRINR